MGFQEVQGLMMPKRIICIITSGHPGGNAVRKGNESLVVSLLGADLWKARLLTLRFQWVETQARLGWFHGTCTWGRASQVFLPRHGTFSGLPGMCTAFFPSRLGLR